MCEKKSLFQFLNFNVAAVEVWGRISNFIPHFTEHVITYQAIYIWPDKSLLQINICIVYFFM